MMTLKIRDADGKVNVVDARYFGKVKQNLSDLERRVARTYLYKLANELVKDTTRRVRWGIDPDDRPQKQNSVAWNIEKSKQNVSPNIPLHHRGLLINPNLYRTNIINDSIVIRVPSGRESAVDNLRRLGYRFFYLPNNVPALIREADNKMTPDDWFAMLDIFSVR